MGADSEGAEGCDALQAVMPYTVMPYTVTVEKAALW